MKQQALSSNRFNELLGNPTKARPQELELLLNKHPYCHALWFLEAKRQIHIADHPNEEVLNSASLYASSPEQLYSFLYADPINDFTVDHQQAVAKLDSLLSQDTADNEEDVLTPIILAEEKMPDTTVEEAAIIDATVTVEEEDKEDLSLAGVAPNQDQTNDDVTKYDDELMPYTFVWWLHKTRLDYAETYQPYAPKTKPNLKRLHNNMSDIVLDQQIRENIFHLQSPEDKLSIKENKTVTFKVSHKTDEIIERFIKEEPQIKPPQANKITLENKAKQSAEDQSIFVSETLAQIYVEQGLYHKAIDAYMKLSLKYPEKSVYFADRIKDLENKIN